MPSTIKFSAYFLLMTTDERGEGGAVYLSLDSRRNPVEAVQRPYSARYVLFDTQGLGYW